MIFTKQPACWKLVFGLAFVFCLCESVGLASSQESPDLLITEVSTRHPEFIEIYNSGDQDVNLDGFMFSYYPAGDGTSWDSPWRSKSFPENAVVRANSYFLVTLGDEETAIDLLGDWNAYSSKMLNSDAGTVAIGRGIPEEGEIVDAVGWGSSCLAVGNPSVAAPEGRTLARKTGMSREAPFSNSVDNSSDFYHALPAPSSSRSGVVLISQGIRSISPLTDEIQISIGNTGSVGCSFSIDVQSEIGYSTKPNPDSVYLSPGEWRTISIRPTTYEYVVVDLETSGLDPMADSIIEAAWVYVCEGAIVQSESSLVFLGNRLAPYITWLTGITNEMLAMAPPLKEVIPPMLARLEDTSVLSYSMSEFDRRFLEAAAFSLGLAMPDIQWVDVLDLVKRAMPSLSSHSLEAVAESLGIEGGHHRALSDSLVTNLVFQEAVRRLECRMHMTFRTAGASFPVGGGSFPINPF